MYGNFEAKPTMEKKVELIDKMKKVYLKPKTPRQKSSEYQITYCGLCYDFVGM